MNGINSSTCLIVNILSVETSWHKCEGAFISLFNYLFICLFIFLLSLWTIAVDLSGLQIYLFSACAKPFLWFLLSIILFTCPFFSGDAGMSTKFVVHNVFHLSESRKKVNFTPSLQPPIFVSSPCGRFL